LAQLFPLLMINPHQLSYTRGTEHPPQACTTARVVHGNTPSQWLEHICALQGAWHLYPSPSERPGAVGKNNAVLVLPFSHGAAL